MDFPLRRLQIEWVKRGMRHYLGRPSAFHINPRDTIKIMVVLKGFFVLETRSRKYAVKTACAVIVPPFRTHRIIWGSGPVEILNVCFRGIGAAWRSRLLPGKNPRVVPVSARDLQMFEELERRACTEFTQRDALSPAALSALVHSWLVVLLRATPPDRSGYDPRMAKAHAMIQANFSRTVKIGELAQAVGMSGSSFRERYRRTFGRTPKQDLLALRVLKAQDLLQETQSKLRVIAADCGFSDEQEFCKRFRRHTGMSPGHWRSQA